MLGYGRDESAPTPDGMFATNFVGGRCIINNPSAMFWQSVSSRRGPIYRARIYVFATHFVGGRCIINNPFAMFWQFVRNVLANRQQP